MILKFTGQLAQIMGEESRLKDWEGPLGLRFIRGHQALKRGKEPITLMEVMDDTKAAKYIIHPSVTILTEEEADVFLETEVDCLVYKATNEALMNANIQKLVAEGKIDLDAMDPAWTHEEELEHLYNLGVSGIGTRPVVSKKFKDMK